MTTGLFLAALALALAGLIKPRAAKRATHELETAASPALVALLCLLIAALFVAQLRTIELAAATQIPYPSRYAGLPVVPIDESPPLYSHTPAWVATDILALTLAETAVLTALYLALRGRRASRGTVAAIALTSALMIAAALRTPAATTQDLYLYVGFGHLGSAAYAPPAVPFAGEFRAVNRLWGLPMLPAAYGPLWIVVFALELARGQLARGASRSVSRRGRRSFFVPP